MRRNHLAIAILTAFAFLLTTACGNRSQEGETAQATDTEKQWNDAKDAYHSVMQGTFHPAEEGNLEPLKEQYAQLAVRAKEWAALPLPANQQGKGLEEALKELETASAAIGPVVQNGSDDEVSQAIVGLHDVFHRVIGMCEDHEAHGMDHH